MPKLQEVHARMTKNKKERRQLQMEFKDELRGNTRYMAILEDLERLKAEKKSIENETKARSLDQSKIDALTVDIKSDQILLSDIALNMYVQQLPVEIVDDMNARFVPEFNVKFKRS